MLSPDDPRIADREFTSSSFIEVLERSGSNIALDGFAVAIFDIIINFGGLSRSVLASNINLLLQLVDPVLLTLSLDGCEIR